jgi:hypothetical protein
VAGWLQTFWGEEWKTKEPMGGGESMPFLTYRCEGNSYRWKGRRWFVALVLGEEGLGCLMARDDISGEHRLSA